ncbi:hypothetical protein OG884_26100 [Streptosporangium sp. NBC_01755]|uniref:hypothetical protein n=1 Tax=unclassified Streptosporangium TaxID=2632669 RepID=UPI002DD917FB|nr:MULTISPECIES: hypothetical protein [unclassified Streptosporangium]WSA23464.1 hypothetical protein OIE13_21135 [Streptosporangium sp. NBC_01810]WSC98327.1 hypothetical protein OG884_26100 [Streptosporangium sp. NBC_01755]
MLWADRLEEVVDLTLWIDPRVMNREQAEGFGTGLARLLIAAGDGDVQACDITNISGISPIERDADWIYTDSCWVSLRAVERLVGEAVQGRPHLVTRTPDGLLTCHVTSETAEEIHAACLALLPGRTSAMAPHRYVVHAPEPTGVSPYGPVLTEGDGRRSTSQYPSRVSSQ